MVYTTPKHIIEKIGVNMVIDAYDMVKSMELKVKNTERLPTRSTRQPKGGVPMAETKNITDIALPALCCASASGHALNHVSTKKAEAMLLKGKMAQYSTTQSAASNQNCWGIARTCFADTVSSPVASGKFALRPSLLSNHALVMLHPQLSKQSKAPNQIAPVNPKCSAITGDSTSFKTEPARAMDRFTPKAKATSWPWNHLRSRQFCATCMDSPPKPKSTRPAIMHAQLLSSAPKAKTKWPAVTHTAKMQISVRQPHRSAATPMINGKMTFGMEYTVYNKLKW
mmetsp:Transcript_57598/g.160447  ORF Transcript_57598/g.160447 Transcript_57598/m.160447 type:complete len:283 (-) Transcript_57598:235-1083(-)